jgi:hypothetical protein
MNKVQFRYIKTGICAFALLANMSCQSDFLKEELTTQIRDLYPKCDVTEKFIDDVFKTSIIDNAIRFGKATDDITTTKPKTDRRSILSIPKYKPAPRDVFLLIPGCD